MTNPGEANMSNPISIYVAAGPEGKCLVIDGHLVAGPGVLSGATIIAEWRVPETDLIEEIGAALGRKFAKPVTEQEIQDLVARILARVRSVQAGRCGGFTINDLIEDFLRSHGVAVGEKE